MHRCHQALAIKSRRLRRKLLYLRELSSSSSGGGHPMRTSKPRGWPGSIAGIYKDPDMAAELHRTCNSRHVPGHGSPKRLLTKEPLGMSKRRPSLVLCSADYRRIRTSALLSGSIGWPQTALSIRIGGSPPAAVSYPASTMIPSPLHPGSRGKPDCRDY